MVVFGCIFVSSAGGTSGPMVFTVPTIIPLIVYLCIYVDVCIDRSILQCFNLSWKNVELEFADRILQCMGIHLHKHVTSHSPATGLA